MTDCTCNNFPNDLSVQGLLGIGTANPAVRLHVVDGGASPAKFVFYNDPDLHLAFTEGYGPQIDFSRAEFAELKLRSSTDGETYTTRLGIDSGGRIRMAEGGGNVGIGTGDPERKLDVRGDARIDGPVYVGGREVINADGQVLYG